MKKIGSLLLAAALCAALAGCGGDDGKTAVIGEIKQLHESNVKIQEETIALINGAIEDGVSISQEQQDSVNTVSGTINDLADLIEGGELENAETAELQEILLTMKETNDLLKETKTSVEKFIAEANAGGASAGGDEAALIEEIMELHEYQVALQEEIIALVNGALEDGVPITQEQQDSITAISENINNNADAIASGELENLGAEELEVILEEMKSVSASLEELAALVEESIAE